MKHIFNKFRKEQRGDVVQYIIVLAVIVVIASFSLVRVKTTMKCTQEKTNARLYEVLFNKKEESTSCKQDGQNETGEENTTNDGNGSGTNSNGDTSSGNGSNAGNGTIIDSDGNITEDENEVPLSHFEESGVNLSCVNTSSYYSFAIPPSAPPQSVGTQAITLKNKKGWDMWIKINAISIGNGLRITTDDSFYRKLSDGEEVAFNVGWKWDVPNGYNGEKGNAKVYLSIVCKEPPAHEIYKPIVSAPKNFHVVETTDTSISLTWDTVDYASEYYIYRNGSLVYKGSSPSYIDENLLPGTTYSYKLYTSATTGTDVYTPLQQKTTGVSPIPPTPTRVRIYSVTSDVFHVAWDGSTKATHYRMYLNGAEQGTTVWTGFLKPGLKPNTSYTFEVAAENLYGTSEKSSVQFKTNGNGTIENPTNFIQVDRTTSSQVVSWNPVAGAKKYMLYAYGSLLYEGPNTSFTHTKLPEGGSQHYFLYAANDSGQSSGVFKSYATLGVYLPTVPYNISISNITNTSMNLSWSKGVNAEKTTIKMNGTEIYSDKGTTLTLTNLTPNTYYAFEFISSNVKGNSSVVKNSVFTTNDTYDDISSLSATCNDENYSQNFNLPANIKIGESGVFLINATNSTNNNLSLKIIKVEKNGDAFGGSTPVKLEYDDSTVTLKPKESFNIPIKWLLPSNATSDYKTKTGDIVVTLATSC